MKGRPAVIVDDVPLREPVWDPILALLDETLTGSFMFMGAYRLEDERTVSAYKHQFTRSYLHLTPGGTALRYSCSVMFPTTLRAAVNAAFTGWRRLSGVDPEWYRETAVELRRVYRELPDEPEVMVDWNELEEEERGMRAFDERFTRRFPNGIQVGDR